MKIYILDFGRSRLDKTHSIYAKKRVLKIKKKFGGRHDSFVAEAPWYKQKNQLTFHW